MLMPLGLSQGKSQEILKCLLIHSHADMYVRTHVHCENRSLIQSLTLMRLGIKKCESELDIDQTFLFIE